MANENYRFGTCAVVHHRLSRVPSDGDTDTELSSWSNHSSSSPSQSHTVILYTGGPTLITKPANSAQNAKRVM